MKRSGVVILLLCFTCGGVLAGPPAHEKTQTISGRIVAYSIFPACLNGNTNWSMIIRAEKPEVLAPGLIRVDFSMPCGGRPDWVSDKKSIQRFRLQRRKDCDIALDGSLAGTEERLDDTGLPLWMLTPGKEISSLPFGQVLPCYRSVDRPLLPAV
jgi:hypothetical protein